MKASVPKLTAQLLQAGVKLSVARAIGVLGLMPSQWSFVAALWSPVGILCVVVAFVSVAVVTKGVQAWRNYAPSLAEAWARSKATKKWLVAKFGEWRDWARDLWGRRPKTRAGVAAACKQLADWLHAMVCRAICWSWVGVRAVEDEL